MGFEPRPLTHKAIKPREQVLVSTSYVPYTIYICEYCISQLHNTIYSLLSVLRISSSCAVTNNSLKHMHVWHSLDVTALRQHITSALWRTYLQLRHRQSCLRRSALWYEGRKISALLVLNFQRRPPVFGTFSVESWWSIIMCCRI